MPQSNLIELTYFDPKANIRLTTYADTIITEPGSKGESIAAVRFGGYPEMVRAMSDAIYGGGDIDLIQNGNTYQLKSTPKAYRRQLSHDGPYATATLLINDEALSTISSDEDDGEDDAVPTEPEPPKPRKCYIFCPAGDRESLFAEVDRKTAAPLIPAFRDYVLEELTARKILRKLKVFTLSEKLDAWTLELLPDDKNVVDVLEQGLKEGKISIPGAAPDSPDGFGGVETVTSYLNTFGVTVAERIRNQFEPLFDPASEPLSEEVLAVNDYIQEQAGYSLYDAQLAVAEAVKRQLDRRNAAFIVAECGSGKTKIGSSALGALHGLMAAQRRRGTSKTFNLVMCPSHVTKKWVREIGETLPDTYAMVVRSITEFDRLYAMYESGDKSVFAVFSKERAIQLWGANFDRDLFGYLADGSVILYMSMNCHAAVWCELEENGADSAGAVWYLQYCADNGITPEKVLEAHSYMKDTVEVVAQLMEQNASVSPSGITDEQECPEKFND